MMQLALFIINICACSVIFCTGLFMAVNNMSRCTDHAIRLAWVCITTGAFGVLAGALYGQMQAGIAEVVLHIGLAIFAFVDRRRYRKEATRRQRGTFRS